MPWYLEFLINFSPLVYLAVVFILGQMIAIRTGKAQLIMQLNGVLAISVAFILSLNYLIKTFLGDGTLLSVNLFQVSVVTFLMGNTLFRFMEQQSSQE